MRNTILIGDVLARLKDVPDGLVQCVVTSPPYWGLRDYGVEGQLGLEATPAEYLAKMVAVFRAVWRVMRDDGTLWLNMGDSYASAGGERSYGSSDGGTGRGPGTRRHDIPSSGLKPKDLCGMPWRLALALQADGWWLRQDIIWAKPNPMPESVTDRCTKAHEYIFLMTKRAKYYYDNEAIKEPSETCDARRPYTSQGAKDLDGRDEWKSGQPRDGDDFSTRNRRSVWTVPTHPYSKAHFATFPPKLIEPCILAGSRQGDIVLDPFMGAGTTGLVAQRLGRDWLGIELNSEYVKMALERIRGDAPLFSKAVETK